MSTLYLHIGHGKTGTSWIQTCLRTNREALSRAGILYAAGNDRFLDKVSRITSGNGSELFESVTHFEEHLAGNPLAGERALFFSSEHIPHCFLASNAWEYIEESARKFGFDAIKVLLFIRNPIGMAVSIWQQRIKRRGDYEVTLQNLHENLDIGADIVVHMEELLKHLGNCKNVTVTIRNYSLCADRLMEEVSDWLEVPAETFTIPSIKRINRSLTMAELIFQINLNRILGASGNIFSDPLCEKLPDLEYEKILPPPGVQQAIWDKLSEAIERVNNYIPEPHRYRCDIRQPDQSPDFLTFTPEQIRIIAESLGFEILNLRNRIETLDQKVSGLKQENVLLKQQMENRHENTGLKRRIKYLANKILQRIQQK